MIKEFIPYEEALALKELGFVEPWEFVYQKQRIKRLGFAYKNYLDWDGVVSAPLYQQAFRWFREKYGLYPDIFRNGSGGKFLACIENLNTGNSLEMVINESVEYEEAELACLRKLIELANESI